MALWGQLCTSEMQKKINNKIFEEDPRLGILWHAAHRLINYLKEGERKDEKLGKKRSCRRLLWLLKWSNQCCGKVTRPAQDYTSHMPSVGCWCSWVLTPNWEIIAVAAAGQGKTASEGGRSPWEASRAPADSPTSVHIETILSELCEVFFFLST